METNTIFKTTFKVEYSDGIEFLKEENKNNNFLT
jgi:hypothetical protein